MWIYSTQFVVWPGVPTQLWHAHEMLYGFAAAAIGGFLLTAVPSWTGGRGFAGLPLVVVTGLWLAARLLLAFAPDALAWLAVLVELSYLPGIAWLIAPPLLREHNRNTVMLGVLLALWLADLTFLVAVRRADVTGASTALGTALDIVLLLVTVIGGRIVPAFTGNALRRHGADAATLRSRPWIEKSLPAVMIVNLLLTATAAPVRMAGAVALAAAVLHALRLSGWRGLRMRGEPIVWVLHLGYAWLPLGFALKALAQLADVSFAQFWQHAFGAGAVATMILAVTTRAALGHTGRSLVVAPAIAVSYGLLTLAALARVLLPQLPGVAHPLALWIAALAWTAAMAIYLIVYVPILTRPRIDAKPG